MVIGWILKCQLWDRKIEPDEVVAYNAIERLVIVDQVVGIEELHVGFVAQSNGVAFVAGAQACPFDNVALDYRRLRAALGVEAVCSHVVHIIVAEGQPIAVDAV